MARKLPFAPPCDVIVEWLDAAIDPDLDAILKDIPEEDSTIQVVRTRGLLIQVGRKHLVLATDESPNLEPPSYRTIHRIPRVLVRTITLLSPGPPVSLTGKGQSESTEADTEATSSDSKQRSRTRRR